MYQLIILCHVVISLALIALILLQQGKGAQMGAAFGAGASQTVFGSQGSASFLMKLTGAMAAAFFTTSLMLAAIAMHDYKAARQVSLPVSTSEPAQPPVQPAQSTSQPVQSAPQPVQPAKQPAQPAPQPVQPMEPKQ